MPRVSSTQLTDTKLTSPAPRATATKVSFGLTIPFRRQARLWLLTEEVLTPTATAAILTKSLELLGRPERPEHCDWTPLFRDGEFTGSYTVSATTPLPCPATVRLIHGHGSFVDCLVFHSDHAPQPGVDAPLLGIEVTKTSDAESRNGAVGQRGIKFPAFRDHFPSTPLMFLYDTPLDTTAITSETNRFGLRLLRTIDVEVRGRELPPEAQRPFRRYSDIIRAKNAMNETMNGTSIRLEKKRGAICISAKLWKQTRKGKTHADGRMQNDPSKGTVALLVCALRATGWNGPIFITKHEILPHMLPKGTTGDKFVRFCEQYGVRLSKVRLPKSRPQVAYWEMTTNSREKRGSILLHMLLAQNPNIEFVFANHAGCERGYLVNADGERIAVPKKVKLPDLVYLDRSNDTLYLVEAETIKNVKTGLKQLRGFDAFARMLRDAGYAQTQERYVAVTGGTGVESFRSPRVLFQLAGDRVRLLPGSTAPSLQLALDNCA